MGSLSVWCVVTQVTDRVLRWAGTRTTGATTSQDPKGGRGSRWTPQPFSGWSSLEYFRRRPQRVR